ncbi:MAG: TIGR03617 family F420-dependent LLM class oxidoreductase [Anaerolineales bacterium]|jgi:probable F420-dependent oxidoreductase
MQSHQSVPALDASLPPVSLAEAGNIAEAAEQVGFKTLWASETQHDPFLPLAVAASRTSELQLGTAVAIAFARSPGVVAYTAWDLAQASGGRFILGLGTQVKPHIERRFGMPWPESPADKLREFVGALRALWRTWQYGDALAVRGEYFRLSLMSPFFNPGPIDHPDIPIFLAGVNVGLARLAGEIAEGFHAHPLHSERYLREVIRPALAEGAARAGRDANDLTLTASVFMVTDEASDFFVRSQIAFYASTPSYRRVMALHGWETIAEELSRLARRQDWSAMSGLVSDEMLATFAIVASPSELPLGVKSRYSGLAKRVIPYMPYYPGTQDEFWAALVEGMQAK